MVLENTTSAYKEDIINFCRTGCRGTAKIYTGTTHTDRAKLLYLYLEDLLFLIECENSIIKYRSFI